MIVLNSKLPAPMVCLAYLAAGLALSVSWAQLRQVLQRLLARCLSMIVMALQIGLGALSDGALAELQKGESDITDSTEKKRQSLSIVR